MDDVIEKFLNSSGNNVTFDMKVKAIQELDEMIFSSTDLKNMNLFERIIEVSAKHLKSTQYKTTYEILVFLSHMNQYLSQRDNMAQYFRIYIPYLYATALERLGDFKEKIRELTFVYILEVMQLASYFPREKFNMVIDKEFRSAIANTRFFRVKEQLILLVVESYKTIEGFSIQYYIPNIVLSLEDSNEVVRTASKEAVINIIKNSQNRPEVIRHIKKELVKNKVRQAIIDSIFNQVNISEDDSKTDSPKSRSINSNSNISSPQLSSGSNSHENLQNLGSKTSPPSYPSSPHPPVQKAISTPVPVTNNSSPSTSPVNTATIFKFPGKRTISQDANPIQINSEKEYESALQNMLMTFQEKESEHNWEKRERFMKQIRGMVRGGAADYDKNCRIIKIMLEHILKTTHSLRTTLAITTIGTIIEIAENYKNQMDPIGEAVITNLLDLTSQTKKLIVSSSTQAIYIILKNISYNPKFLHIFMNSLSDKNANTRSSAILFIGEILEDMVKNENSKTFLVRTGGLDIIEKSMKKGLQDANPSVRETSRSIYGILNEHWKDRASALLNTLDITTRKALLRSLSSSVGTGSNTSSPKLSRRTKLTGSPALAEQPLQSTKKINSAYTRGKSQPVFNSPKLSSQNIVGTSKLSTTTSHRTDTNPPSSTFNSTVDSSVGNNSGLNNIGQQHIRRPMSMSPQRTQTAPIMSYVSSNSTSPRNSVSSSTPPSKKGSVSSQGSGLKIENSSLLQSMNQAFNSGSNFGKPKSLHNQSKSSSPIRKDSGDKYTSSPKTSPMSSPSLRHEQFKQQKLQQLQQQQQQQQLQQKHLQQIQSLHEKQQQQQQQQQQKEEEKEIEEKEKEKEKENNQSSIQIQKQNSYSNSSSPISEKDDNENISPICLEILKKLKDKDWKNRAIGLENLLTYITSPEYESNEKLTKTFLSLFRDPSPYILNVIFKPAMIQGVVESRFVSLDKLIPKIYSVIEPPDEKTGEFDDISKTAYDAIVWLKSKIRKDVILDSLLMCLENKLNNQFMSETVFEGILSWLVEIINRSPDSRDEVQRYFFKNNNYNVALEELLELLLRREDNNSINNVYIIKLIESLQELNPSSYDDVMSEYAENIQYIILKRIHNNDYDLSDIERDFIQKELSTKSNNKFRESHLFESFSLDDPKSNLLIEETVPEGFSDLTISRNTSMKTGLEATDNDNYSENSSILNELVNKTWNNQPEVNETLKDGTKSEISDQQSTPKLSFKKTNENEMEEDIIHISSPIEINSTELLDPITNKEESNMLDSYNKTIDDDRLSGLNKQFKLLIDIIHESNKIDHDILDIKVFRRLIRYSREFPLKKEEAIEKEKTLSISLWNQWFKQLYDHLYQYVDNETNVKNIENYENCILLFKHLIVNQTKLFNGLEEQTMRILVKCRSLNIDEVCSASEDTIDALCDELDSDRNINACLNLLNDDHFLLQSPLSSDIEEYRPSYMGTLYMILAKIIQSIDVSFIQIRFNNVIDAVINGMNHPEVEVRKAALDVLVSLYFVYNENSNGKTETGIQFLNTITGYLTLPQRRILDIYIQKFQY
ncbi:ARM repeat-containing protein [Anaeromyces robustus]|uniref:ARM repeat-containing protein n=1 Tax=Anaeromyces robustus TaxID=1754192 RepID=A0A1Y1XMD3_9FUNG|nr:ARM repeat-containing protein [Anaeromyces robustus]|eukprot:ORX86504.1 ARM repeat-containing protein [Anaeromyces robustus]